MAEAAISFAVEKLGNLAIEKVCFLRGVEDQVKWLKDELETMQCFLKDAAEDQRNFETIRKWIKDIREVAHDAEDVIDTFILQVETPKRSRRLLGRCACFLNHLWNLNTVGQQIESIRNRLKQIDERLARYKSENVRERKASSSRSNIIAERRRLYPWQRDKHMVGVDEDVKSLLQRGILDEKEGLSIASIVGMGGIGKSTLARAVYNHNDVRNRFDCRAWVVVSEQFNLTETIKELVLQLLEPNEKKQDVLQIMKDSPEQHLKSMLHERLKGKQYFIVVDDVWRQQDWESLASAFPDEKDTKSKLFVTSRNRHIPRGARYVHEMKTLDNDRSWELLLQTAFDDNTNISRCPDDLEDIGREILTKCDGLPLAITVVGGLLLEQRQSRSGWQKVLQGIDSHLGRNRSSSIQAILELSYHDLPPFLKSCFLCLGFFEEDATICVDKLVHIWIAQGLILQEGEKTMEDTSRDYLDELINRNMIQAKNLSKKDGRVKNCQIHDLLRELSIRKAKEEISFEILKDGGNSTPQSLSHKPRHCVIYHSTESYNIFLTGSVDKHIRSVFFHGGRGVFVDGSPPYKWKSFRLLRTLDMTGLGLRELPDTIGELIGLRYLGLRDNGLTGLPNSLSRLTNLQVLDMLNNYALVRVSNVITKMVSLRHLYAPADGLPLKMDCLKNLQTLMYIYVDSLMLGHLTKMLEHLTKMASLRKLGVSFGTKLDVNEICTSLAVLENLVNLHFKLFVAYSPIQSLDGLVSLRHLTQLKVEGELTKLPSASNFPPNLSYLKLKSTKLEEDPMPILEKLPRLLHLKLYSAYNGKEMVISHQGFPSLKVLHLRWLPNLKNLKVEKGGMSQLKQLEILYCIALYRLPEELKFMSNLQELKVWTAVELASAFQDVNSHIISNIPSVTVNLSPKY